MKAFYTYYELAQEDGLRFFKALPAHEQQNLWHILEKVYTPAICQTFQKKVNETDSHLLDPDILAYLIDFLPENEALFLIKYEIHAKFSKLMPTFFASYDNYLPLYFELYFREIQKIDWKTHWYISQKYNLESFSSVGEVEKYFLLQNIAHAYHGYYADLEIILPHKDKLYMNITKVHYRLAHLDIDVNLAPQGAESNSYDIPQSQAYIESIWAENRQQFPEKIENIRGAFKVLLQEQVAHEELACQQAQAMAFVHQTVAKNDLTQYVASYKKINKIKNYANAKIELKMQGGTLYMQASSRTYWTHIAGWLLGAGAFAGSMAWGHFYLWIVAAVFLVFPSIYNSFITQENEQNHTQ